MELNTKAMFYFNTSLNQNLTKNINGFFKQTIEDIPEVRIFTIIFLLIFVTGVCGNGLVVFVFVRNRAFRTMTNMFLLNLAIVDLVYLIVCCPFTTVKVVMTSWPFGNITCKLVSYLMVVCMCVNVLTLVAIGLDRFCAIVLPIKSRSFRNKRNTCIIVMAIWGTSLVAFTPIWIITRTVRGFDTYCIEQLSQQSRVIYNTVMFLLLYVIPQVLIGYLYTMIASTIRNSRLHESRMNRVAMVTMQIRCRIVKLTFTVSMAFAICWLPMHIAAIMNAAGVKTSHFSYYFQLFVPCFAYATVSLNPIIYCFMSRTFRESLKATFTCHRFQVPRSFLGNDPDMIHQQNTPSISNSNGFDVLELATCSAACQFENRRNLRNVNSKPQEWYIMEGLLIDKECQTEASTIARNQR